MQKLTWLQLSPGIKVLLYREIKVEFVQKCQDGVDIKVCIVRRFNSRGRRYVGNGGFVVGCTFTPTKPAMVALIQDIRKHCRQFARK